MLQSEADRLLNLNKFSIDSEPHEFPDLGGKIQIPLQCRHRRESFFLDISRKRIALTTTFQIRARQTIVLARLDFGARHRNPDGAEVGIPHLHLYREGYADQYAYELTGDLAILKNPKDSWQSLMDFMQFCSIVKKPVITRGLFS